MGRTGSAGLTAGVRDPWGESDGSGSSHEMLGGNRREDGDNAHDPHEVTVQLDGMGRQLDDLLVGPGAADEPGGAQDGSDGPVFVDESGRRSRLYRRMGIAVGFACAVYAVVIVVTLLSGNSNAPWLPVPGQDEGKPAGKVGSSTPPTDSATRASTDGSSPGSTTPTVGQGTATAPTPGATASGASASPAKPGTSAAPKASPTSTAKGPGTGPTASTPTPTATPSATGPATPTPTGSATTPTPTPTVTTGTSDSPAPGSGPVADGPNAPTPVATESTTAHPAPSSSTVPVT